MYAGDLVNMYYNIFSLMLASLQFASNMHLQFIFFLLYYISFP